jgi:hypothetical protein
MRSCLISICVLTAVSASVASGSDLVQHWQLNETELNFTQDFPGNPAVGMMPLANEIAGGSEAWLIATKADSDFFSFGNPGAYPGVTGTSIDLGYWYERIRLGNVSPGADPFTVSLWFKWNGTLTNDAATGVADIISSNNNQAGRWNLNLNRPTAEGPMELHFFHGGVPAWSITGTNREDLVVGINPDQWYHFAMTRDETDLFKLYLDGAELFAGTNAGNFTNSTHAANYGVLLGRRPSFGNTGFDGSFDDVRFYDGALTAQQFTADWLSGDANRDGSVDIADLGILAANWQASSRSWIHGDFNLDGEVNIADLGILAANWQSSLGESDMSFDEALAMFDAFAGVVVPEPVGLGLVAMAGVLSLRRRFRR